MGIYKVIIVQNKIDLVKEDQALKNYKQIRKFLQDTKFADVPIIPISAQLGINIDVLIKTIQEYIPTPDRDPKKDALMFVARSFDVNKPGAAPEELVGGVVGGALVKGEFKTGDEIELKPGRKIEKQGRVVYEPITTTITALKTGGATVKNVIPGGSIGVMTNLDPYLVKSDSLTGMVVGKKGKLPPVWQQLVLETDLLERVVGSKEDLDVEPIKIHEPLMLNVNAAATVGVVSELSKNKVKCALKIPVCASVGSRVTISRRVGNRFRLIGFGIIKEK